MCEHLIDRIALLLEYVRVGLVMTVDLHAQAGKWSRCNDGEVDVKVHAERLLDCFFNAFLVPHYVYG